MLLCGVFQLSFGEILNCQFNDQGIIGTFFYTCEVTYLENSNNSIVVTGHNGIHQPNKYDTDVRRISIHDTNTKFIPENLGHMFNLAALEMENTQLVQINAKNFLGMEELKELYLGSNKLTSVPLNAFNKLQQLRILYLSNNQIEELPNGLFINNLNLNKIYLHYNKIKFIGSTLFDGLSKLDIVNLWDNICIDERYDARTKMIDFKKKIKEKCFNSNEDAKTVEDKNN